MEEWITDNLLLKVFDNNKLRLTKYFGKSRSSAIESKSFSFTNEESKKKAITQAKKQIAEERNCRRKKRYNFYSWYYLLLLKK